MKKGFIFGILMISILVSGAGCEKEKVPVITDELETPACTAPYFEYNDNECCLDLNDNKICDVDETLPELPPIIEPIPDTTLFFYEMEDYPAGAQSCDITHISVNKACVSDFNSNPSVTVSFDNINTSKTPADGFGMPRKCFLYNLPDIRTETYRSFRWSTCQA